MPSKKRKYNARFPAGRIKKIMQTDEEVGKVAQAVPIIISRTLELFVESLLGKALQVTTARNAKTLSPSHVKQCILGEARFDFLRDLVKNIPDVSVAEEKELMSAESSPNSSSIPEAPPRRLREDSNSSSSCDVIRVPQLPHPNTREHLKMRLKRHLSEADANKHKSEASTSTKIEATPVIPTLTPIVTHKEPVFPPATITVPDAAIDLSKKEVKPVRTANFYHETLVVSEDLPSSSVIKPNPTYSTSQPSTSYTTLNPVEPVRKVEIPKTFTHNVSPRTPVTPITPVINIDFSKNLSIPEIKVLDKTAANIVVPKTEAKIKHVSRQNSKSKIEVKKAEPKPVPKIQPVPIDIDSLNSGNPQIDEDYDT